MLLVSYAKILYHIFISTICENFKSVFFSCLGQTEISELACLFDLSNWNNQSGFEAHSLDNILTNGHCLKKCKRSCSVKKLLHVTIQFLYDSHLLKGTRKVSL